MSEELKPLLAHQKNKSYTAISCQKGWYPLLVELNQKLEAIDPDYNFVGAKEKYARLQFWALPTNKTDFRKFQDLFEEYENKSLKICEDCGEPGDFCEVCHWERTLCDACFNHEATSKNLVVSESAYWRIADYEDRIDEHDNRGQDDYFGYDGYRDY